MDVGGARTTRNTLAGILGILGGILVGAATFLPWAEATTSLVTSSTLTVSGWDWFDGSIQTGPVFVVFALAAAALGALVLGRISNLFVRVLLVAFGALSLGLALYAIIDILSEGDDLEVIGDIDVTFSYGLAVIVFGALLMVVAGLLAKRSS